MGSTLSFEGISETGTAMGKGKQRRDAILDGKLGFDRVPDAGRRLEKRSSVCSVWGTKRVLLGVVTFWPDLKVQGEYNAYSASYWPASGSAVTFASPFLNRCLSEIAIFSSNFSLIERASQIASFFTLRFCFLVLSFCFFLQWWSQGTCF